MPRRACAEHTKYPTVPTVPRIAPRGATVHSHWLGAWIACSLAPPSSSHTSQQDGPGNAGSGQPRARKAVHATPPTRSHTQVSFAVERWDTEVTSVPGLSGPRASSPLMSSSEDGRRDDYLLSREFQIDPFLAEPISPERSIMTPTSASASATSAERGWQTPQRCACGHPPDEHDPIAARYCAATTSSRLCRGCICMAPTPSLMRCDANRHRSADKPVVLGSDA